MNEDDITISAANASSTRKSVRPRMKFNLICASKCKKFALEMAKENPVPARAKMFTRVSEEFLMHCEVHLKEFIRNRVKNHPSKGKTLT